MKFLSFIFTLLLSVSAYASSLNKIVVFGDSLSDNGNFYEYMQHQMPLSPPYYQGRFTNSPVWVELLTSIYYPNDINSHLLDYAFGGAGVLGEDGDFDDDNLITLNREVDSYLLAHEDKADADSLFIIWMGANNYLSLPDDLNKAVEDVNWGIKQTLIRLAEKGAKHILVINLPDLGKAPAARDFDAVESLSYCSSSNNALLEKNVESLRIDYPAVQWIFFDVNHMLQNMLDNPSGYGLTNIDGTCYEQLIDSPNAKKSMLHVVARIKPHAHDNGPDACNGYLFFDPVHPAKIAHQVMAERINKLLLDQGIVFD